MRTSHHNHAAFYGNESWKDRGRTSQRCRLAIGAVRPDADWALRVDAGLDDFLHPQSRAARSAAETGCLSPGVSLLLWSLCLFEVKHFLCDFVLQTAYLYRNKGIYGHPAGFIHAGLHAVGSLPAILLLSRQPGLIALLVVAEFLIHYHVDWLKLHVDKRFRLGVNQRLYWAIFGADQLLHQLTYLGIIAVLTA